MKNRSLWIMLLITMIALHVSAAEITVTYMQSGTYDKAAEKSKQTLRAMPESR
jgi:flagellar basal body-associated protein FliL